MSWDRASERLRFKGILSGKPLIGPRSVNVHLTNACDRQCQFCWYFSPMVSWHEKRKDIDFDVLKRLIRDCAGMGVEEINLEGGEVVLYPRIAEVFRLVHRLGMSLAAYTHLDYGPENLDYFRLADRLNVNFSATTPVSYHRIHGGDGFGNVINNLRLLSAMRKKFGKPSLVLTFIINEMNYREIEAYIDLMDRFQVDRVAFRLFEATVEMKSLVFSPRSIKTLQGIIARAGKSRHRAINNLSQIHTIISRKGFGKDRAAMSPTKWNNDRLFYYHAVPQDKVHCYTGWFNALIDERGRVVAPCDNIGVCIAGNIYKESFKDIWFGSTKFQKIRQDAMRCIDIKKDRWRECRYCGHVELNRSVHAILGRVHSGPSDRGSKGQVRQ